MSYPSARVVTEFCQLCNWAYEVWLTHRTLFDDNPLAPELQVSIGGDALGRLSIATQEILLHEISKLHDQSNQGRNENLGIEYIVECGDWSTSTRAQLVDLQSKLNGFAEKFRPARNKLLSHNDLDIILGSSTLGAFQYNEDVAYFDTLQEFVNVVHAEVIGGPFPFNDLAYNDAIGLLSMLKL